MRTSIQLCGRLVLELQGERLEARLPGRQGRLVFGYLVDNRKRAASREALQAVVWPDRPPANPNAVLNPLVSKLRKVLGEDVLQGRTELRLVLPDDSRVDTELARARLHEAESAIALGRTADAWLPARVAWSVGERQFMAGYEGEWIEERRRELGELRLRALECTAEAGIELGGEELPASIRASRALVAEAPYRETGHRLLMESLAASSNVAEALHVYEHLRCLLRDELGIAPGEEIASLHRRLLIKG